VPDRAVLFVDGNNWYHALKEAHVHDLARLDYRRISEALVGPRTWIGTRYYIGRVDQAWNAKDYAAQRSFLARMTADDPAGRITAHLGRLERRKEHNQVATELLHYLANLKTPIDPSVYHDLVDLAKRHRTADVLVEKAVDVMLAVDLVVMAERDEYDAAYILSADGDFTPAVEAARSVGKKVYAVSTQPGAALKQAANAFVRLDAGWFAGCYRP